ncbi:MAG TPA: hypothetical protein PLM07_20985 [Candidatus Rifleibacterium sp.]|nr:hypothetical protein [Candidatus Rifleibacterium sp.]
MKHWNYRVVRSVEKFKDLPPTECLTIHQVHYDEGKVALWAEDAAIPMGSGPLAPEELHGDLKMLFQALSMPILNKEDMPK